MARRGSRRYLPGVLLVMFAAGLAAGVVAGHAIPGFVERRLLDELAAIGIDDAALTIRRIGWTRAVAGDIRIGANGDLTIGDLGIEYHPGELIAGRLRRVIVIGARLRGTAGPGGVSFGALDVLIAADPAAATALPPINVIELRGAEVTVATPLGEVTASATGEAITAGGVLRVSADVELRGAHGTIEGRLTAEATPGDGVDARFDVNGGRLVLGPADADGLAGSIRLGVTGGAITRLEGRLTARVVALPGLTFADATLDIAHTGDRLVASLAAATADHRLDLEGDVTVDRLDGATPRFKLAFEVRASDPAALGGVLPTLGATAGTGRASLSLSGDLPDADALAGLLAARDGLAIFDLAGDVDFAFADVALPGLAAKVTADGRAELRLMGGALTATSRDGIRFEVVDADQDMLAAAGLGAAIRRLLVGLVTLDIGGKGRPPLFAYLRADGDALSASAAGGVRLALSSGPVIEATLDATLTDGGASPATFVIDGEAMVRDAASGSGDPPRPVLGTGRIALAFKGALGGSAQPATALDGLSAAGIVTLALDGAALPGLATGIALDGAVDVELTPDTVSLTAPEGLVVTLGRVDSAALAGLGLGEFAAIHLDGPLRLALGGDGRAPPFVSLTATDAGKTLYGATGLRVTLASGATLDAEFDATAELDPTGELIALTAPHITLSTERLALAASTVTIDRLSATLAGTPSALTGSFSIIARATVAVDAIAAERIEAELDGRLDLVGDRLTVSLRDGARFDVGALRVAGFFETSRPLSLRLAPSPVIEADWSAGALAVRHRIGLLDLVVEGDVALPDGGTTAIVFETPELTLDGTLLPLDGGYDGVVATRGASLRMPGEDVAIDGIDVTLDTRAAGGRFAEFSIARLRHGGEPAFVIPLRLAGVIDRTGDRLDFTAKLGDDDERMTARLTGTHDLATHDGRLAFEIERIGFAPGQVQPSHLFPLLQGLIDDVTGVVAAEGVMVWSDGTLIPDVTLLIEDVSATVDQIRVERANAVVRLDGVWPPSTHPGQLVAVALLDAGLPLTDGIVTFQLTPEGTIDVDHAEWRWAGGTISTGVNRIDPAADDHEVVFDVADIDLARVVALAGIGGLEATGLLSGRIPVSFTGAGVVIAGGVLEAGPEGGVLRYKPDAAPSALREAGETATLMFAALENFEYERLRITLDRKADGDTVVGLHLRGANPSFYDGYPVEFNINISGELDTMLQRGLESYRIPDVIAERLREFGS